MIQISDIKNLEPNQKIALIGLGKELLQFLDWLLLVVKIDPKSIVLADAQEKVSLEKYKIEDFAGCYFGSKYLDFLTDLNVEYIFKAPGIWSLKPEFVEFRARKGGDRINSSLVFFFQKFKNQIISITGTKGKSTTSALTNHLLSRYGFNSHYCGNTTGISPYEFWKELDQEPKVDEFFVIETSSFQLEDLGFAQISSKYGIITNYYVDHLDQHADKFEYWRSKDNIFKWMQSGDLLIANNQVLPRSKPLQIFEQKILPSELEKQVLREIIPKSLVGEHNLENSTLACCAVLSIFYNLEKQDDVLNKLLEDKEKLKKALAEFKPLSHRIEFVTSKRLQIEGYDFEVSFYDDGFASEPDAVVAAIKTLCQTENDYLWLFIAGKDKYQDISELSKILIVKKDNIFRLDTFGEYGKRVRLETFKEDSEIRKFREFMETFQENFNLYLQQFVEVLKAKAKDKSDTIRLNVLLSPGSSSFDEFANQTQRAEYWVDKIKEKSLD